LEVEVPSYQHMADKDFILYINWKIIKQKNYSTKKYGPSKFIYYIAVGTMYNDKH